MTSSPPAGRCRPVLRRLSGPVRRRYSPFASPPAKRCPRRNKANETTGEAEPGTIKFYSTQDVLVEGRKDFKPGEVDKFTIVIFIEGDDPDCIDALIGGEMKMHMDITEEHIKQDKLEENNQTEEQENT